MEHKGLLAAFAAILVLHRILRLDGKFRRIQAIALQLRLGGVIGGIFPKPQVCDGIQIAFHPLGIQGQISILALQEVDILGTVGVRAILYVLDGAGKGSAELELLDILQNRQVVV